MQFKSVCVLAVLCTIYATRIVNASPTYIRLSDDPGCYMARRDPFPAPFIVWRLRFLKRRDQCSKDDPRKITSEQMCYECCRARYNQDQSKTQCLGVVEWMPYPTTTTSTTTTTTKAQPTPGVTQRPRTSKELLRMRLRELFYGCYLKRLCPMKIVLPLGVAAVLPGYSDEKTYYCSKSRTDCALGPCEYGYYHEVRPSIPLSEWSSDPQATTQAPWMSMVRADLCKSWTTPGYEYYQDEFGNREVIDNNF